MVENCREHEIFKKRTIELVKIYLRTASFLMGSHFQVV